MLSYSLYGKTWRVWLAQQEIIILFKAHVWWWIYPCHNCDGTKFKFQSILSPENIILHKLIFREHDTCMLAGSYPSIFTLLQQSAQIHARTSTVCTYSVLATTCTCNVVCHILPTVDLACQLNTTHWNIASWCNVLNSCLRTISLLN